MLPASASSSLPVQALTLHLHLQLWHILHSLASSDTCSQSLRTASTAAAGGLLLSTRGVGIFKKDASPEAILFNPTGILYIRHTSSPGLSAGAIAGIALAATAAAAATLATAALLFTTRRRRRRRRRESALQTAQAAQPASPPDSLQVGTAALPAFFGSRPFDGGGGQPASNQQASAKPPSSWSLRAAEVGEALASPFSAAAAALPPPSESSGQGSVHPPPSLPDISMQGQPGMEAASAAGAVALVPSRPPLGRAGSAPPLPPLPRQAAPGGGGISRARWLPPLHPHGAARAGSDPAGAAAAAAAAATGAAAAAAGAAAAAAAAGIPGPGAVADFRASPPLSVAPSTPERSGRQGQGQGQPAHPGSLQLSMRSTASPLGSSGQQSSLQSESGPRIPAAAQRGAGRSGRSGPGSDSGPSQTVPAVLSRTSTLASSSALPMPMPAQQPAQPPLQLPQQVQQPLQRALQQAKQAQQAQQVLPELVQHVAQHEAAAGGAATGRPGSSQTGTTGTASSSDGSSREHQLVQADTLPPRLRGWVVSPEEVEYLRWPGGKLQELGSGARWARGRRWAGGLWEASRGRMNAGGLIRRICSYGQETRAGMGAMPGPRGRRW